ncbi:MAG: ELM1/GtrOC1 family putative glycosyltransferase [Pseudomonadales bacterium]
MGLLIQRALRASIPPARDTMRPPAVCERPETIVFGVRSDMRASFMDPVDIYVGSERSQFRAEHAFLWSIETHRDPSRVYRVHLMRDLAGFRRRLWLTGFTNYRFAIPSLAGGLGRAIYNDVDQIYLTDPAKLFDTTLGGAGFLSVSPRDSSVMLMDCERMQHTWTLSAARRLSRRALEQIAVDADLWGELDASWNARDAEYDAESSRLVHFTALQTQPWRPFPDQFVYLDNPTDPLWAGIEQGSMDWGYLPIRAARPSRGWNEALSILLRQDRSGRLGLLLAAGPPTPRREERFRADFLDRVPDLDVPWVLDRLFRTFRSVEVLIDEPLAGSDHRWRRSRRFWLQQLEFAFRRNPDTHWALEHRDRPGRWYRAAGGPAADGAVVVLVHRKPGHNQQARAVGRGLAARTSRRLETLSLDRSELWLALRLLFTRSMPVRLPEDARVIVASAWISTRIARRFQRCRPELRLVLCGRKAGAVPENGGVLLQCAHFHLPPDPNRLETTLPLNAGEVDATRDTSRWRSWAQADRRFALLMGGSSRSHTLSEQHAREIVREVSRWAAGCHASLLVVTGRRTASVIRVLAAELSEGDLLYRWQPGDPENPYSLALRHADQLIVTGESESMLADAVSRGRKFLVWPLPARPQGPWMRLGAAVFQRASQPCVNRRGSIRPQQGLTYLCARALERGWVLPPRDLDALHRRLYDLGMAAPFGQTADETFDRGSELDRTLDEVIDRLHLGGFRIDPGDRFADGQTKDVAIIGQR